MSELPEVQTVARLMELVARYGLEELEVEEDGLRIHLRAPEPLEVPPLGEDGLDGGLAEGGSLDPPPASRFRRWPPSAWPGSGTQPGGGELGRGEGLQALTAPVGGIFYRTRSPDSPPFVEVGDEITEGQVVALIEAMKVFSEIPAPFSGTVVEILVQNGQMVHHGDELMYVRTS